MEQPVTFEGPSIWQGNFEKEYNYFSRLRSINLAYVVTRLAEVRSILQTMPRIKWTLTFERLFA